MKKIYLVGKTGTGKSSLMNFLAGREVTKTYAYGQGTEEIISYRINPMYELFDTPGLDDCSAEQINPLTTVLGADLCIYCIGKETRDSGYMESTEFISQFVKRTGSAIMIAYTRHNKEPTNPDKILKYRNRVKIACQIANRFKKRLAECDVACTNVPVALCGNDTNTSYKNVWKAEFWKMVTEALAPNANALPSKICSFTLFEYASKSRDPQMVSLMLDQCFVSGRDIYHMSQFKDRILETIKKFELDIDTYDGIISGTAYNEFLKRQAALAVGNVTAQINFFYKRVPITREMLATLRREINEKKYTDASDVEPVRKLVVEEASTAPVALNMKVFDCRFEGIIRFKSPSTIEIMAGIVHFSDGKFIQYIPAGIREFKLDK